MLFEVIQNKIIAEKSSINKKYSVSELNYAYQIVLKEINTAYQEQTGQARNNNQAKEKALLAKEKTVKDIFELVAEGNDIIQGESDKAILFAAGAGKSTLAHLLGVKQLKAVYDNKEDEMLIEAVDNVKDIIISHKMVAETKIPGKQ